MNVVWCVSHIHGLDVPFVRQNWLVSHGTPRSAEQVNVVALDNLFDVPKHCGISKIVLSLLKDASTALISRE
jgi:hypothetical protein